MNKLPCILLVDDDKTTNYLNQQLLNRLGVAEHLLVALDGKGALIQLENHCAVSAATCPSLVLLDVNMPGMNGIQFLEAYQQLPLAQQQATVIVMLTTSLHPRDVERVKQFPVAGFVSKPLTEGKVKEILHTHFQQELPAA
ncbi:response regulator [Hymenobacter weizhouensis]|uniref:response regulator n=1 Tax=Hymenobacter sp. YIM 151500-1 TaxID=2987689 RepID=UPI002226B2B0|nr:response regulator [Hymenobacter sp. YIM 151500-1]UYZ64358.1 response regulator [Hymenobacter sp. YIM 151500-1]